MQDENKTEIVEKRIEIAPSIIQELFGGLDENSRAIEELCGVKYAGRRKTVFS